MPPPSPFYVQPTKCPECHECPEPEPCNITSPEPKNCQENTPKPKEIKEVVDCDKYGYFITVMEAGGLGNKMSMYATAMAVAASEGYTPIITTV